ncbi:hypothetical protein ACHQM5_003393 [Ranunculus cassubicifolius]
MDRQGHEYAAAMAFAQQQAVNMQQHQQFGFPPPHQQFPPQVQGPPFLPPHHSLQQFPYHRHLQQQHQIHPHPHHLVHLQQQQQAPPAFPPHLPPHLAPSPFHNPYDSAPPPAAPPSDPAAKNGPEFEAMIREKQRDNPAYAFLFGGEGHNYYRYKLWITTRPINTPFSPFPPSSIPMMPQPSNSMSPSSLNSPAAHLHQSSFPPLYDQQQHSPFLSSSRQDYEPSTKSFKGLSGPLPSDVAVELNNVLNNLSVTKESIKSAKMWFMQRSPFAPALAEALRDRVFAVDDSERQLHIVFLANDILFDSLQRRINPRDLDNEALAFKPIMGSMLGRIYHNPHNQEANQSRLQKILQFWALKEVYDPDAIYGLERKMIGGPPSSILSSSVPPNDLSSASADSTNIAGTSHPEGLGQWHHDRQRSSAPGSLGEDHPTTQMMTSSQFAPTVIQQFHPPATTLGSLPVQTPIQPSIPSEKLPPYPLFPPGLRKMQIGNIPTAIPPSTLQPSDVAEKVSKFFKEIGEANPSDGPVKSPNSSDEDNEYGREAPLRKGGACIPPPPNLQLDPESGTYADGSFERKPGSSSTGRLGLGASANPNEASQYDDVYSSYRKHRSTSYHTSMSARASAR